MDSIKKYRSKLGLSQIELGKKVGVGRACVIYWESKKCNSLTKNNAKKLTELFQCTEVQLYGKDSLKIVPQNDNDRIYLIKCLLNDATDKEKILEEVLK